MGSCTRSWTPVWQCQEAVTPLRGGVWGKVVRALLLKRIHSCEKLVGYHRRTRLALPTPWDPAFLGDLLRGVPVEVPFTTRCTQGGCHQSPANASAVPMNLKAPEKGRRAGQEGPACWQYTSRGLQAFPYRQQLALCPSRFLDIQFFPESCSSFSLC